MSHSVSRNIELALDMMQAGIDMMRLKLQREHPNEPASAIDARLMKWRLDRPMDGPGRTLTWEEFSRNDKAR